ncbi:transcription factor SPT20 homolog [Drosophila biarmipes]|uniref:transcription factor SPT20 homolog n=1 Tax=Drosophila biarmipes TaxID=125945 RepID=UPI0007E5FF05|nr:transcription factor SPT20 homolog [Drosophila biarmipes]XP_050741761.1 transcription factor SPT20 homolog [Drosophila biarmipes]
MVVSESESEFLSESEPEPMSEHQAAIDGNLESLLSTPAQEGEVDLSPECDENRTATIRKGYSPEDIAEPKDLDERQTDIKSPAKEDTTRPLVLEERHSLSIAETKKRRASVYSNELLFIPKELARSELQQRTRSLSRYAKNREYHLRMLKFPVGSGRPRYVAKQMKKDRDDSQPTCQEPDNEFETNEYPVDIKEEEFLEEASEEIQDLRERPLNMPDLGAESEVKNQLPDDEEISVKLFDLVKKEVGSNDSLEEQNRKILQSQRESVIRTSSTRRTHYPYLCWHNPEREALPFKMEPTSQWKTKSEPEIQDGNDDTNDLESTEDTEVEDIPIPDLVEQPSEVESQQPETISYLYNPAQNQLTPEVQLQEQVAGEVPATNPTMQPPATSGSPEESGQTADSLLRQQLIHHIVQPNLCNEQVCQSISCNNNAADRANQNLRHHQYVGASAASDPSPQWNPPNQPFHKQQLHIHQQYLQQQLHQSSSQQQQEAIYQQHQHEAEDKLQQMRVMYQRIKCREEEQLHQLGKSLKKLLDDRLSCERQHAEEKRLFMLKMEQIRKVEEKLKSDREHIKRQLRSDLRTLELRMADQQRQQEEKALAWSWQQQQQQQQQQLQQQQLLVQQQHHFVHHHHSQETHYPNQEPYMQQSLLYDPPPYVYPTAYQESIVYQQRIQAFHDHQQNYNPAESHTTAVELQRRLLLPPPPYCQSNSRTSTEVSPNSRKVRHRPAADQRTDPYARTQLRGPLPPAAEIMQLQRSPHMSPPAAQVHEPRSEPYGMASVMTNYVANLMNMRAER